MEITTQSIEIAKLALDGLQLRQKAIASNTANVDTSGYRRKEVNFESQLTDILNEQSQKTRIRENNSCGKLNDKSKLELLAYLGEDNYSKFSPMIQTDTNEISQDGNNVVVEKEMMDMAQTAMRYNVLATLEGNMFTSLQDVIKSGGGN